MARKLRRQEAGLTYHVFTKAIREEEIYRDRFDRMEFLRLLGETVGTFAWICHSYCQMSTHYHLLVTTTEANIGAGMQALNGRFAEYFNRRHRHRGHLFRGRYGAVVIESEPHFLDEFRYLARNPVRAGMCMAADQWPWSSYRATLGLEARPSFLTTDRALSLFSGSREEMLQQLRRFVDGVPADREQAA